MLFQGDFEVNLFVALDAVGFHVWSAGLERSIVLGRRIVAGMGGWGGEVVWRALLQPDVVGDFGEGTFALLLQPGVRHCGFRCREGEATVMLVFWGL